jgi:hypothetical protein
MVMFSWLTKIILSASIFLGFSSPAVLIVKETPVSNVVSDESTPTPIISPIPTLAATQTPTKTITTTPVPSPADEAQVLLSNYLSNPTPEQFTKLCNESKSVTSNLYREILDTNRQNIVKDYYSLYDLLGGCAYVNNSDYLFVTSDGNKFDVIFEDDDSDDLRRQKIQFNQVLSEIRTNNKYFLYSKNLFTIEQNSCLLNGFSQTEAFHAVVGSYTGLVDFMLITPELEARKIIQRKTPTGLSKGLDRRDLFIQFPQSLVESVLVSPGNYELRAKTARIVCP